MESLRNLTVAERIQLVEELWDSIAADAAGIALSPAQAVELDRRLDALDAAPEAGAPWAMARDRILAGL